MPIMNDMTDVLAESKMHIPVWVYACIREAEYRYKLSPRQMEICIGFLQDKTSKEIADELFISESTVKTHIEVIFEKMCVRSRTGIVTRLIGIHAGDEGVARTKKYISDYPLPGYQIP